MIRRCTARRSCRGSPTCLSSRRPRRPPVGSCRSPRRGRGPRCRGGSRRGGRCRGGSRRGGLTAVAASYPCWTAPSHEPSPLTGMDALPLTRHVVSVPPAQLQIVCVTHAAPSGAPMQAPGAPQLPYTANWQIVPAAQSRLSRHGVGRFSLAVGWPHPLATAIERARAANRRGTRPANAEERATRSMARTGRISARRRSPKCPRPRRAPGSPSPWGPAWPKRSPTGSGGGLRSTFRRTDNHKGGCRRKLPRW
jgi:hypothetical protein